MDADVIFERDILLGDDDQRALDLAEGIQRQLVDMYQLRYPLMELCEQEAFGQQSFFIVNNELDQEDMQVELPPDEPSEDEQSESEEEAELEAAEEE